MAFYRNALKSKFRKAELLEKTLSSWVDDARRQHDDLWQQRFQEALYAVQDLVGRLERGWLAAPHRLRRPSLGA
jgi:hypothetical protein